MKRTIHQRLIAVAFVISTTQCIHAEAEGEAGIIPNKFQAFQTINEDGLFGERVNLWRDNRMWFMTETDFLLGGFENRPGTHAWQGEHIGKWLHAAILAYRVTGDEKLKEELDSSVRRLLATQEPNGYLGTYAEETRFTSRPENTLPQRIVSDIEGNNRRRTGGRGGWDTWTLRYNIYGLLVYDKYFPTEAAVEACKKMGDLLIEVYGEGKHDLTKYGTRRGISATTLLESIVMLYQRTLDKKYLNFAEHIVVMSEGNPKLRLMSALLNHEDVHVSGDGKAYQLMANLLGYLQLYRSTAEKKYLTTVLNGWNMIKKEHLLTTGGPWSRHMSYNGNRECFAKPEDFDPDQSCVEVCSTTTWMQMNMHLFELTGDAQYLDELELSLFNANYHHQFTDGIHWNHHPNANNMPEYVDEFRCCASSGPRGMEMFSNNLAGAIGDSLVVSSLTPASIRLPRRFGEGTLRITGNYPVTPAAEIHFETLNEKDFTLEFRLPRNTLLAGAKLNGRHIEAAANNRGFLEISRKWVKGDVLSIEMGYELGIVSDSNKDGRSWFSITYGPIALAQPIKDLNESEPFEGMDISLNRPNAIVKLLSPAGKPNHFKVEKTDVTLIPYYMSPDRELGIRTYFEVVSP